MFKQMVYKGTNMGILTTEKAKEMIFDACSLELKKDKTEEEQARLRDYILTLKSHNLIALYNKCLIAKKIREHLYTGDEK